MTGFSDTATLNYVKIEGPAPDALGDPVTFTFTVRADVKTDTWIMDDLAVDPSNPHVGSSGHTGGVNVCMADGSVRSDEGPEETVAFDYGKLGDQTFDDLAVDPNYPNAGFPG